MLTKNYKYRAEGSDLILNPCISEMGTDRLLHVVRATLGSILIARYVWEFFTRKT